MNLFIGVDPDLHTTPFAVIDENGRLLFLEMSVIFKKFKAERAVINQQDSMIDVVAAFAFQKEDVKAFAVESQNVTYTGRTGKNPQDMIPIAQVAGGASMLLAGALHVPDEFRFMPRPSEWKGNVPKQIHHARICKLLGWECQKRGSLRNGGYCRPLLDESNPFQKLEVLYGISAWKHFMDAIGLAFYAKDAYRAQLFRNARSHV